jgi:hypothetical protein
MNHFQEKRTNAPDQLLNSDINSSEISSANNSLIFQPSNFWNGFHRMDSRCPEEKNENPEQSDAQILSTQFIDKEKILSQIDKYNLVTSYVEKGHLRGQHSNDFGLRTISSKKNDFEGMKNEFRNEEHDKEPIGLQFHKKSDSMNHLKEISYSIDQGNCFFNFQNASSKNISFAPLSPQCYHKTSRPNNVFFGNPSSIEKSDSAYYKGKNHAVMKESYMINDDSHMSPNECAHIVKENAHLGSEINVDAGTDDIKRVPISFLLSNTNIDNPRPNFVRYDDSAIERFEYVDNDVVLLRPIEDINEHQGLRVSQNNSDILMGLKQIQNEEKSKIGGQQYEDQSAPVNFIDKNNIKLDHSLKEYETEERQNANRPIQGFLPDYYELQKSHSTNAHCNIAPNGRDSQKNNFENSASQHNNQNKVEIPTPKSQLINKTSIESEANDQKLIDVFYSVQPTNSPEQQEKEKRIREHYRQTDPPIKLNCKPVSDYGHNKNIDESDHFNNDFSILKNEIQQNSNEIYEEIFKKTPKNKNKLHSENNTPVNISGLKLQSQSLLSKSYNLDKEPLFVIEEKVKEMKPLNGGDFLLVSNSSFRTSRTNSVQAVKSNHCHSIKASVSHGDNHVPIRDVIEPGQENQRLVYSNFSMSINIDNNDFIQHLNKFPVWERGSANELFLESGIRDQSRNDSFANLSQNTLSQNDIASQKFLKDPSENKTKAVRGTYYEEETSLKGNAIKSFDRISQSESDFENPFLQGNFDQEISSKLGIAPYKKPSVCSSEFMKKSEANLIVEEQSLPGKLSGYFTLNSNFDGDNIPLPFSFLPHELTLIGKPDKDINNKTPHKFSINLHDHKLLVPDFSEDILGETNSNQYNIQSFRNSKFCNGKAQELRLIGNNKTKFQVSKFEPSTFSPDFKQYVHTSEETVENQADNFNEGERKGGSLKSHNNTSQSKRSSCLQSPPFKKSSASGFDNSNTIAMNTSKSSLQMKSPVSLTSLKSPTEILRGSLQKDEVNKKKRLFESKTQNKENEVALDGNQLLDELFEKKNQLLSMKSQFLEFSFENQMTEEEKREFKVAIETIDCEITEISKKIILTMEINRSSKKTTSHNDDVKILHKSPNRTKHNSIISSTNKSERSKPSMSITRCKTDQSCKISCDSNSNTVIKIPKIKPQFNEYFAEQTAEKNKFSHKSKNLLNNRSKMSLESKKSTSQTSHKHSFRLPLPINSLKNKTLNSTTQKLKPGSNNQLVHISPWKSDDYFSKISNQFKSHNVNSMAQNIPLFPLSVKDMNKFASVRQFESASYLKMKEDINECTFAPRKIANQIPITGSFEERNSNWERNKELKLHNKLSEKIERESSDHKSFKPEINPLSRMIVQQKPENFYDRQKQAIEKRKGYENQGPVKKTPSSLPLFEKELLEMQILIDHAKKVF